jgi:hypothetical protein
LEIVVVCDSPADALGVGNEQQDALPEMSGTKRGSGQYVPETIIPERAKSRQDSIPLPSPVENNEAWRVFKHPETGSKLAHDSDGFGPEPSWVERTAHLSDCACRTARNPARNDQGPAVFVGELVGSDAGAFSKIGVAPGAMAVSFFIFGFAVISSPA